MNALPPGFGAAVLASHGDRAGATPNAALLKLAGEVRALTGLAAVTGGVLKGEPSLEQALDTAFASGTGTVTVYPLFMADGYFVKKVLAERVAAATGRAREVRILAPLGLDPALPDLLIAEAVTAATHAGIDPAQARLLVVGHGSKLGPASATATRKAATRAALARRFASVATAFLEEEPFIEEALRAANAGPTVVAGFFFGDGLHAGEDVPDAIAETGADAVYAGPIGNSSAVAPLIAAALISNQGVRT
jgi:sirohydrochlorin ferrochelatase